MLYPELNHFDLFDDLFTQPRGFMKTDITEKDGNFLLNMEMPGYQKEDVKISLDDGYLTISATHKQNNDEKDENGKLLRKERYEGSCSRSFYIGDGYKQEDIKAVFDNGELKITLPSKVEKVEEPKQYIEIE
ncbi:MAG: Hsp20/alpha crystallin family protein [Catenisphaera adipataccumulans]|uniref:Hsp20/alpha crystallin family protein n=1 Tax=Catenisphaera adipataccumulans TaxID=700500 RepID=UPI003D9087FB